MAVASFSHTCWPNPHGFWLHATMHELQGPQRRLQHTNWNQHVWKSSPAGRSLAWHSRPRVSNCVLRAQTPAAEYKICFLHRCPLCQAIQSASMKQHVKLHGNKRVQKHLTRGSVWSAIVCFEIPAAFFAEYASLWKIILWKNIYEQSGQSCFVAGYTNESKRHLNENWQWFQRVIKAQRQMSVIWVISPVSPPSLSSQTKAL